MLVIPAIDLKSGKCVRLMQGRMEQETVYGDDPAEMARAFAGKGARMIHLVDLDGAFRGESANLASIRAIRAAVDVELELGGGLRSLDDIAAMLELGVDSVILGTVAVHDADTVLGALQRFGGQRIQLGIDARDGRVAVKGWAEETALDAIAFGQDWRGRGIERAIYTDIATDGMMRGPNLDATREFAEATGFKVTASGGVTRMADVRAIAALEPLGVERMIIGKALYEGTIELEEALTL